jgi:hypothetical protein
MQIRIILCLYVQTRETNTYWLRTCKAGTCVCSNNLHFVPQIHIWTCKMYGGLKRDGLIMYNVGLKTEASCLERYVSK